MLKNCIFFFIYVLGWYIANYAYAYVFSAWFVK
jgi:hypothetical protein